ncbi:MAG: DUF932 domain-containing protein [Planctomycetota bacterium]|nr:DUF932 domain-containing protein [Planctomycetota bacterium]
MAHQLETNHLGQIEACFAGNGSAVNPAWHNLGKLIVDAVTSRDMIQFSGMDWDVGLEELKTESGIVVPDYFATVRKDSGKILGVVGKRYKIVQNRDAFAFLDSLTSSGEMLYESAGVLRGGGTVWCLARLPSVDEIAPGDSSYRYVLFSTSHDGTGAIQAIPTSIRIVCANTLAVAVGSNRGIRHTENVRDRMAEARLILSQYDKSFDLFRDSARKLAETKYSADQAKQYILELFPEVREEGKSQTIRNNKVEQIRAAWRNERNNLPSIKGTWWQLVNAVTETIDHDSTRTSWKRDQHKAENRFQSLFAGAGADMKTRALNLAKQIAGIPIAAV